LTKYLRDIAGASKLYRFKPAILPTVATAAFMGLFVALGMWQLNRAQEKRAMLLQYERSSHRPPAELRLPVTNPAGWRYRHVKATGRFDSEHQFLLENQISRHQVGYDVLTPLILPGSQKRVLVDRGWVPLGTSRDDLPQVSVTTSKVTIKGIVYVPYARGFSLGSMTAGETGWPLRIGFINFKQMSARLGAPLAPMIVRLDPGTPHGYRRAWQVVPFGPERHLGYAVQWFAMACTLLAIYLSVNLTRVGRDE
jgi:surfeit locus 1 family protein